MTAPAEAPREALPEPMPVVAWLTSWPKDRVRPAGSIVNRLEPQQKFDCNKYDPLVRLTDAQSALESERQAHAAEVAALKAGPLYSTRLKARRYDWLRNEAHPDRDDTGLSVGEQDFNDWGKPFTRYLSGDALDAAIDQAIARGTK